MPNDFKRKFQDRLLIPQSFGLEQHSIQYNQIVRLFIYYLFYIYVYIYLFFVVFFIISEINNVKCLSSKKKNVKIDNVYI